MQRWFVEPRLWDMLGGAGVVLIAVGLWWIYPPLALLAVGGMTAGFALWGAKTWTERKDNKSFRRRRGLS